MPDRADSITIIGPDTHIKGELSFESNACILGRLEGTVSGKGHLQVGNTAHCRAAIDAARVVVEGTVEGDIVARDRLELKPGASVTGDITATRLVVEEGATFVGNCRVGESAAHAAAKPATTTITNASPNHAFPRATPKVVTTPAASDIEATLAGFESKLAEFGRAKSAAGGA